MIWAWKWQEEDSDIDHVSESSGEYTCAVEGNPYIKTDTESDDLKTNDTTSITPIHTVTFKCIGATHDSQAQHILQQVSKALDEGKVVPVNIFPEPDNQFDCKAIAFKCKVAGNWHRIGYVVNEALDYVHEAILNQKIKEVSFAWVKYLVVWMRSGPGFYAGINISLQGQWPVDVSRCASTH